MDLVLVDIFDLRLCGVDVGVDSLTLRRGGGSGYVGPITC
jgi:hypothetical protein